MRGRIKENFQVAEYPLEYSWIHHQGMERMWHMHKSAQRKSKTEGMWKKQTSVGGHQDTADVSEAVESLSS